MDKIKLDYSNVLKFVSEREIKKYDKLVAKNHALLMSKLGIGSEFTDWITLPKDYDQEEFARIKSSAEYIDKSSQALIVIGIGGSYLGARAVIEALTDSFNKTNSTTKVYFAGNNLSSKYVDDLINEVKDKDFCINVISKSGTTTEPAIVFDIFKKLLEEKYGKEESKKRIFVTTDKERGILKPLAIEEGYETFIVPDGVGGRYSVLTAVGLLPIAVAGLNIDALFEGAKDIKNELSVVDNIAYKYAVIRNILYKKNRKTEILVNYEPSLTYITEWWKQLYGESEGKDGKGILPVGVSNTTDLHSMGQYIQDGRREIFETVLNVEGEIRNIQIDPSAKELEYLKGMSLDYVNKKAMEGTIIAHVDGQVPNIIINIPELSEYYIGGLIYFFEMACAMSGYILGVNPFNQPGVEAYKKNMFELLGKE